MEQLISNLSEVVDNILIEEQWKDIVGYEGLYQVSSFGRIKTLKRLRIRFDKIKKLYTPNGWYSTVSLCNSNGVKKRKDVHVLVAKHFIPNPENKPEVNHKKGIKSDNRVWQLEWTTHKENIQHSFDIGLSTQSGINNAKHKLNETQVLDIFNSTMKPKDAVKYFGIKRSVYYQIKLGITWSQITGKKHYKLGSS